MAQEKEPQDGVEHLKHSLYSRKRGDSMRDVRAPLSPSEAQAPVAWAPEESPRPRRPLNFGELPEKSRMAFATKFFIGSAVFFIVAAAAAAAFFISGGNYISGQNIDVQVVTPALIDGGSVATVQYVITNRNSSPLQLADLVIDYPDGTRDPKDPSKSLAHDRLTIGTIEPGRQVKLTSSAAFYGSEGSTQAVKATLEYSVAGSNAIFVKEGEATMTVGSSPVSVSVSAPQEVIAGQSFTTTITVQSNAASALNNVILSAQYPFGFSVQSASPKADAGSTVWRLGTMAPGATQVITVAGSIDGQDGDERVFRFTAGTSQDPTGSKVEVPFLSVPASLTVRRPFITGSIAIEGQSGAKISAPAGKTLQGTVTWRNNLAESVSNVQITLKLSGPALDSGSVNSGNGFYQSNNSTITWTSAQDPSLAQVAPGATGMLQFSFATLSPGSGGVVYTNPTVGLDLSVGAVRAGQGNVPETVSSAASTEVSLSSSASLSAQALHFSGPYSNSGAMPPRAESPTTYTVVWTVKNSSNTLANTTVSTVLPTYVDYVQGSAGVSYDAGSRTVRWDIGDLAAGVGYSASSLQAAFQVRLTPSASQVGSAPLLTGASALSGTDRFAQVSVGASAEAPSTKLSESGFASGMDIVAPK